MTQLRYCFAVGLTCLLFSISPLSSAQPAAGFQPPEVAKINGIDIAWTEKGPADGVPLLMVMGLGASHIVWGEAFTAGLVEQGFRLILFDNRDVGQSQRFDDWGQPVLWWNFLKAAVGLEVSHPYTLSDMGDDAIALLDMLEIERAHVMGASMGGMIAQTIAIEHPERVISLISIMSSSGAPHLPEPSEEAVSALRNTAETPAEEIADVHARGFYPEAIPRQLMAILQSGDRSDRLQTVTVPTLVIHGQDDPLLPLAHGEHTAEVIPDAQFRSFPGMAHNIPAEVRPAVLAAIESFAQPQSWLEVPGRQASGF